MSLSAVRVFRRSMSTAGGKGGVLAVLGGSGFVGQEVIRQVGVSKEFGSVRVISRDANGASAQAAIKTGADYGVKVEVVSANLKKPDTLQAALEGSSAAVNLVGIIYETSEDSFYEVHNRGAMAISGAISAVGVPKAVHISALGATMDSESKYYYSKAFAEDAFRAKLPHASIIRPALIVGKGDHTSKSIPALMRMMPFFPVFGPAGRVQPVHVGDVAQAILRCCTDDSAAGQVYEVAGPELLSWEDWLYELQCASGVKRPLVPMPYVVGEVVGSFLGLMPKPLLTRDQVLMLKYNAIPNMTDNALAKELRSLADLGIVPAEVRRNLAHYG